MQPLLKYLLISFLVVQICACKKFGNTEDCSTCKYNCYCVNAKPKNSPKEINRTHNKKIEEKTNKKAEELVQEIDKNINDDSLEEMVIKNNCPKCIWGCNCTIKTYKKTGKEHRIK
ncbi:hypothetical protein [Borrelia sp. RT1S]|uniref:hypothetical protein n=1 Tax=Borrelia sp. RT1S TaxID=2898580 RepID=UPI001E64E20A|nr:hypothetical protein [Borrelia sp. RT1S]UGQ17731.1 hypothetical protein LSO05_04705 [Borrelia sp. RT1S]